MMNTRAAPLLAPTSSPGQRDAHAVSTHGTGGEHAASRRQGPGADVAPMPDDGPHVPAAPTHEDGRDVRAAPMHEDGRDVRAAPMHEDGRDVPAAPTHEGGPGVREAPMREDGSDVRAAPAHEDDPDVLARTVGDAMYAADEASRALGMQLDDIGPGRATLTMRVRRDMLNGHRTCHGGFIFSLADSAFAFACNSRNVSTVASGCTIDFLAPAREGDILTATAQERSLAGRTGIYDVTVCNEDGHAVAVFRGRSYRIKGQIVGG
jgi:acyl-CoA thioesterase